MYCKQIIHVRGSPAEVPFCCSIFQRWLWRTFGGSVLSAQYCAHLPKHTFNTLQYIFSCRPDETLHFLEIIWILSLIHPIEKSLLKTVESHESAVWTTQYKTAAGGWTQVVGWWFCEETAKLSRREMWSVFNKGADTTVLNPLYSLSLSFDFAWHYSEIQRHLKLVQTETTTRTKATVLFTHLY